MFAVIELSFESSVKFKTTDLLVTLQFACVAASVSVFTAELEKPRFKKIFFNVFTFFPTKPDVVKHESVTQKHLKSASHRTKVFRFLKPNSTALVHRLTNSCLFNLSFFSLYAVGLRKFKLVVIVKTNQLSQFRKTIKVAYECYTAVITFASVRSMWVPGN